MATVRSAALYKKGRKIGIATSKGMDVNSNDELVATDDGNVVVYGVQTTSFNVEMIEVVGGTTLVDILTILQNKEEIDMHFGVVGSKICASKVKCDTVSMSSDTNRLTGTATFNSISGKVDLSG
jgi:hypothetical protein